MMRLRSLLLVAGLLAAGLTATAQAPLTRTARLTPSPIEAATAARLTGSGSATGVLRGTTLSITGTFEGLQSPATAAGLHAATPGLRGPMIAALDLDAGTAGTLRAEIALTDVQTGWFRDGRLYIQLQSDDFPEGLLRGWLVQRED